MSHPRGRRGLAATALLLATALLASSCADDPAPAPPGTQPTGEGARLERPDLRYVAIGDSYSAAPGVPVTDVADGCFRSSRNYPSLVAEQAPRLDLVDVTCGGADTRAVLRGQRTDTARLPSQVSKVTRATDLVTFGVGGNDENLFAEVVNACLAVASEDPEGSPCADQAGPGGEEILATIARNVGSALDAVALAAPDAQIIVVGYPKLLPDEGTCPRLAPIAAGDYPLINETNERLTNILRDAARERDLDYVDTYELTRGHDVCADDPWINGSKFGDDGSVPFHPRAPEQQAVARRILQLIPDLR